MALRIVITESTDYNPAAIERYREIGDVRLEDCSRADLLDLAAHTDVLVVRIRHRLDAEVMDASPCLRCIVTPTTGLNHIDTEEAARRGVAVLSLRGETDFLRTIPATAEHTWGLLLALQRRIPWAAASVGGGEWGRDAFRGRDLHGRTLGIMGLGRIGRLVAGYGIAFGMRVVAYDIDPTRTMSSVESISREALLETSDVISLHVPLVPETVGLIGARDFARMKPGALLINTSRGEVLEEPALLDALVNGWLGGAALDVLAGERGDDGTWLNENALASYAGTHDDLLITPHIGGATLESMHATEMFMACKLGAFFDPRADRQEVE